MGNNKPIWCHPRAVHMTHNKKDMTIPCLVLEAGCSNADVYREDNRDRRPQYVNCMKEKALEVLCMEEGLKDRGPEFKPI